MSAGVDEGLVNAETTVQDLGSVLVDGVRISNWDFSGHGTITMRQVLIYSSNVGSSFVARRLGPDRFYKYLDLFGFGQPTGIRLPGEAAGSYRTPEDDALAADRPDHELVRPGRGGHAAADDQRLRRGRQRRRADASDAGERAAARRRGRGGGPRGSAPRDQLQDGSTANRHDDLGASAAGCRCRTASQATSSRARPATADTPTSGGYQTNRTTASQIGFAPVQNPRFVMLVRLDAPEAMYGGGGGLAGVQADRRGDAHLPADPAERAASDAMPDGDRAMSRESLAGQRAVVVGLAREGTDLVRYLLAHGADVRVTDRRAATDLAPSLEALAGLAVDYALGAPTRGADDADALYLSPGAAGAALDRRGATAQSAAEQRHGAVPGTLSGADRGDYREQRQDHHDGANRQIFRQAGRDMRSAATSGCRLGLLDRSGWAGLGRPRAEQLSARATAPQPTCGGDHEHHPEPPGPPPQHGSLRRGQAADRGPPAADRLAILNADDPWLLDTPGRGRRLGFRLSEPPADFAGAYLDGDWLAFRRDGADTRVAPRAALRLRGRHNLANALCASAIAGAAGSHQPPSRPGCARSRACHTGEKWLPTWRECSTSMTRSPRRRSAASRHSRRASTRRSCSWWRARQAPALGALGGGARPARAPPRAARRGRRIDRSRGRTHGAAAVPRDRVPTLDAAIALAGELARPGDVVLLAPGARATTSSTTSRNQARASARWRSRCVARSGGHERGQAHPT